MSSSVTTATTASSTPRPVIYLTGDSLTQHASDPRDSGWVAMMQHRYNRSADVIPRGMSGYNTKWFIEAALPVFERELLSEIRSPALITLWLGANDAALPDGVAARQHVPIATYKENLVKIVHVFEKCAPQAKILLITPPHVDDVVRASLSVDGRAERTNAAAGEYARACVETAAELGINVLDLYSFFNAMPENESGACLDDGMHFSTKGNQLVHDQLQVKIKEAFPDVVKQLETWQLPDFHIWMDE